MCREPIFVLVALTIVSSLLIPSASGQAQYPSNGVAVTVQIMTNSGSADLVVGDSFTYSITMRSIGGETIASDFNVSIYNPAGDRLGTRIYQRTIQPDQNTTLLPAIAFPMVKGQNESEYFFFDSAGAYKLSISSSTQVLFFRISGTRYLYQPAFVFYFDAMPIWEKNWKDQLAQSDRINRETSERVKDLTQRTLTVSTLLYRLTYVIGILTVANISVALGGDRRKLIFGMFILGTLMFVLLMNFVGIPWL